MQEGACKTSKKKDIEHHKKSTIRVLNAFRDTLDSTPCKCGFEEYFENWTLDQLKGAEEALGLCLPPYLFDREGEPAYSIFTTLNPEVAMVLFHIVRALEEREWSEVIE